jgi:hypothetical protein
LLAGPNSQIEGIEECRQKHVEKLLQIYYNLLEDLAKGKKGCSRECSAILLGSLFTHLVSHSLFLPAAERPYIGIRVDDMIETFSDIPEPVWRGNTPCNSVQICREQAHPCSLALAVNSKKPNFHVSGLDVFSFVQGKGGE